MIYRMLERLTADDFRPHLGDRFLLHADDATTFDLELVHVTEAARAGTGRTPFSIAFRGPLESVLPQRIYRLEHVALGALEIFIVPIGPDEAGMRYEAVFT
jgi:hypothetical protein